MLDYFYVNSLHKSSTFCHSYISFSYTLVGNIDEAIEFSIPDFVPGVSYSLIVSAIDVDEQTDTEVVEFEISGMLCIVAWEREATSRMTGYFKCRFLFYVYFLFSIRKKLFLRQNLQKATLSIDSTCPSPSQSKPLTLNLSKVAT